MRLNYILETKEGIFGFEDREEFISALNAAVEKGGILLSAWTNVSYLLQRYRDIETDMDMLTTTLSSAVRFRTTLSRAGKTKDGFPRLMINIPMRIIRREYINPDADWEIIIVSPGTIPDIPDFSGPPDTDPKDLKKLYDTHFR